MASSYRSQSLFDVNDIVAVITGGGSGLGRVIAHTLAANGAKAVFILGRRLDSLNQTCSSSPNSSGSVIHPIVCDVTSKESLKAAAEQVAREVGYCNVVFANSGVGSAGTGDAIRQIGKAPLQSVQEALWKPDMDDFTKSFHVNVTGVYYTAIAFLVLLDEGNRRAVVPQKSQVVVTSSVTGLTRKPMSGFAYGPSKAAAMHLAKQLATFLAPIKIRVNTLAPGLYPSEMTNHTFLKDLSEPRKEGAMSEELIPLGRSGTEDEMAGVTLFITSNAGAYLDGSVLVTDGGHVSITPSVY